MASHELPSFRRSVDESTAAVFMFSIKWSATSCGAPGKSSTRQPAQASTAPFSSRDTPVLRAPSLCSDVAT
jgi:hypothetical protein